MKQITKSYLEFLGVTDVTSDGKVFTKRGEISPRDNGTGYQCMLFSGSKENRKPHNIYIHQIVFAWFNGEIPYGKTIHHKDLNRSNNNIDNLVALTPEEHRQLHNLLRNCNTEEKCRLDIPREHYVKKIAEFESEGKHSNAAQYKRRLRYYDSHIEEAQRLMEQKKDLIELTSWKKLFKEQNNLKMWHECNKVEKYAKENKEESSIVVKHALETIHRHFGKD
jgi:hypothetical protein